MPKVGLVPAATLGAIALLAGARLAGYGGSLSALAVILVSAGLLLGAIAWMRSVPREGRRATAWDVAGMLTFVGCISAMLSD